MNRAWWSLVPAGVVITLAAVGPLLAPHRPDEAVTFPYDAPSSDAWLGGGKLGQDVWSMLLAGGWGLLLTATVIAVAVTAFAAVLGAIAVLRPGVGRILERCTDVLVLLPPVLAILLVILSWPGSGAIGLIGLAVLIGTPYATRVIAAAAAGIATSGYVETAVASGERLPSLIVRELLPNLRGTLVALFGLRFVEAVYVVSTAAYLQLPTSLGTTNWALMVRDNSPGLLLNPWATLAPSLAIGVLAVSVNLATTVFLPRPVEVHR